MYTSKKNFTTISYDEVIFDIYLTLSIELTDIYPLLFFSHHNKRLRKMLTLYDSFVFSSFLKYPRVTFGPPITISPRGIGESLIKYPPSGQSIS